MDLSKQELVSILADYKTDKEIQTNPGAKSQFAKLMQQQEDIYNASGIQDLMFSRDSRLRDGNAEAFNAIADSLDMLADLQAAGMNDDDISDIRANLKANNIQGAFQRAGEEATSAIVDAYTKWGATSKAAETLKMQVSIMEAKAKMDALPTVQRGIDNLTKQFPWLWTLSPQEYLSNDQLRYAATKAQKLGITGGDTVMFGPMKDRAIFSTQALPNQLPANQSGARAIGPGVDPSIVKNIGAGTASPSADLPNVDVEGGLPAQEKLDIANEILGEGYGGWFGARYTNPGVGTWPNMGPFGDNKTLTPDQKITEATNKVISDIRDLNVKLDRLGASKVNDRITIKPGIEGIEGFQSPVKFTEEELSERGSQAVELFKALGKAEAQLKAIQGKTTRQTGL